MSGGLGLRVLNVKVEGCKTKGLGASAESLEQSLRLRIES